MAEDRLTSAMAEGQLNDAESKFGPAMTASEVARHFGEKEPEKKEAKVPTTKEEVEEWERKEDNSNDIYKIAARVKNLARGEGANLTSVGDMLCNSYTHVLKALYDFAETLSPKDRDNLIELVRKHEDMPANVIAASKPGRK